MNPYDEPIPRKRLRRVIVAYPLRTPDPVLQPALDFNPAQPAAGELTIAERFAQFHAANPHVYRALRELALELAERGQRRISPKLLFEALRARGTPTATAEGELYRLNNIYTAHYARLLAAEPGLQGRIPMRRLASE